MKRPDRDLAEALRLAGLGPPALRRMTFESFELDSVEPETSRPNYAWLIERAEAFAQRPDKRAIFGIFGAHGLGKTHLAAAMVHRRIEQGDRDSLFTTVPDLFEYLRDGIRTDSYWPRFEYFRRVGFLVLDDLGAEAETAWTREKLYQLVAGRQLEELPTVITGNMAADGGMLAEEAIRDRVEPLSFGLLGESYRRRRKR